MFIGMALSSQVVVLITDTGILVLTKYWYYMYCAVHNKYKMHVRRAKNITSS